MRQQHPSSSPLRSLRVAAAVLTLGAAVPTLVLQAQDPRKQVQDPRKVATPARVEFVNAPSPVAAGEYLTTVGGCNDCHTQGWAESNGRTPPAERLAGTSVGYRGPWGTTYPANLRLVAQRKTEDAWVRTLTTADGGKGKPPMPWMNTAATSDRDLRAMYRYIRGLGPRGEPAPRALPPGRTPNTPFIDFVPVQATPRR
jgi:hypothetical protein